MKNILVIITIAVALFACNTRQTKNLEEIATIPDTLSLILHVEGMTCDHCEMTIQGSVSELSGLIEIKADHEDSTTFVKFDAAQTNIKTITEAIEKKGYHVVGEKPVK